MDGVETEEVIEREGLVFYGVLVQYEWVCMMQCDDCVSFMVIDPADGIPLR
jgi:hypothetical protein